MPKLKKQHYLSMIERRKMLQTIAQRVKVEAEEAESIVSAARQREQTLTDICRYMEQLLSLGDQHSHSKASSNSHADRGPEAGMHAAQQAPAQGVAPTPCAAGQPQQVVPPASSCPPSVMTGQRRSQHQQQLLQQPGNNIQEADTLRGSSCSSASCPPQQQQQPMSSAALGASTSQAAAGCVAGLAPPGDPSDLEHMLHLPSLSSHVAAVLSSVPPYCCMSGLLQTISHELLSAAAALTAQDWISTLPPAVYELTMLLELSNREEQGLAEPLQQQQQQPQQQRACRAQTRDETHSNSRSGMISSSNLHPLDHVGTSDELQPPAAGPAAGGAVPKAASSGLAAMGRITDSLWGISTATAALSPTTILPMLSINYREPLNQQTQPTPPLSHERCVVRRVGLSKAQAAYISACTNQIVMLQKEQRDVLQRLTPLAGGHSLLFMAAEPPLEQLEQQQLEEEQQAEWQDLLRLEQRLEKVQSEFLGTAHAIKAMHTISCSSSSSRGNPAAAAHSRDAALPATAAAAAGVGGAADAADAVIKAMSTRTFQLALWGILLMHLILDTLTTEQKAKLLVASYPWAPAPVPFGLCAGELLLPENQHHLQPGTVLQQQRQEHQQQHRQQWWLKVLQELPLTGEEMCAVAAAAGISASDLEAAVADMGDMGHRG